MNPSFSQLVTRIREHYQQLDVRTDQCDTVRVHAPKAWKWTAYLVQRDAQYQFGVISLARVDEFNDFEDDVVKRVICADLADFENQVLADLGDRVRASTGL